MRDNTDESAPPSRFRRVSPRLERCVAADLQGPQRPTGGRDGGERSRHMVAIGSGLIAHSNSLQVDSPFK